MANSNSDNAIRLHRATIRSETRVIDAKAGLVEAVASTESADRGGDVIRADGWDLSHFEHHPVLVDSHNYKDVEAQIGRWHDMRVRGKRLVGNAEYFIGAGNKRADWAFQLASRGMAAYSVGFIPDMAKAVVRDGGNDMFGPFEFKGQELLEVSQVVIPANADALQRMKSLELDPAVRSIVDELIEESDAETRGAELEARIDLLERRLAELEADELAAIDDGLTIALKGAIPYHKTPVSDAPFDGPKFETYIQGDGPTIRRKMRQYAAWVDPNGDAETKSAYKLGHHIVSPDGTVGAASREGCIIGIAELNGARNGVNMPASDRRPAYNHLARHLRDAGMTPAPLKTIDDDALARTVAYELVRGGFANG